eukprot:TRINITY_DN33671_c0_g1_i1.p3 TRINITY_DN33671_c0_g1~~TRINITY_DN33671_c0_g1_i1.p3  ORF type:complete len:120 (+),score=1.48 TRINITY_DN33671_c0_g1_i1:281-640(+)
MAMAVMTKPRAIESVTAVLTNWAPTTSVTMALYWAESAFTVSPHRHAVASTTLCGATELRKGREAIQIPDTKWETLMMTVLPNRSARAPAATHPKLPMAMTMKVAMGAQDSPGSPSSSK